MKRASTYRLYKKTKTKVVNVTASVVMVAASLSGVMPLLLSHSASAAATIVTPASSQGWTSTTPADTRANGHVALITDNTTSFGQGALSLKTDASPTAGQDKAQFMHYLSSPITLASVTGGLSYYTKQNSASFAAGDPSYQIPVLLNGNDGGTDFATLVYEPYVDQGNAAVQNGVWQNWNVGAGKFWSSKTFTGQGGTVHSTQGSETYTLDQLKTFFPNAQVLGYGVNVGSNNPGYDTEVDEFTFNDTTYDFEPVTTTACTTTDTVNSTSLSAWDLSQTRATGHNEVLAHGLQIYTEGATSTDKAAGYYSTDFPLSGLGDQTIAQSLDYSTTPGGAAPGLQLNVDFNNDGTVDGTLVGETVYGNDWWLSNASSASSQFVKDGAPNNGGGSGSQWHGTINEWLSKFPNAQVKAIGYSLGSGVHGDGVINKISLGCTDYTFGLAAPTLLTPANNGFENTNDFYFTWSDTSAGDPAVTYEFQSDNNGSFTSPWDSITNGNNEQNHLTSPKIHSTGAPDGTYFWRVRTIDGKGNPTAWSDTWKMTIDSSAPAVPTNLSWNTSTNVTVANNGSTNVVDGTASWQDSSSDVDHYIYKYWNDIPGNQYKVGSEYTTSVGGTSLPGVFNQGEGVHHFCVEAVDAAGNVSACSATFTITYAVTPPAAPTDARWLNHAGDVLGALTNVNLVTPAWNAPASGGVDHYEYSFRSPTADWSAPVSFSSTSIPDQSFYGAGDNGTEGPWQFRVRSVGPSGLVSDWDTSPVLTYDKTAPTSLTNVSPSDGTVTTTAGLTKVDWTDATDANGPVTYFYEVSHSQTTNGDGSFTSPVYQSGALSASEIPTPNTPAGIYYWHVKAVDAAGNSTPWTGYWKYTIDNTAPVVTISPQSTTDTTPTVTGTVDDSSATVKVTVNGHTYDATVTGTTWSADVTNALAVGTYDIVATATDPAGNSGTDNTTDELTITAVLGANTGNNAGTGTNTSTSTFTFTSTSTQTAQSGNANSSGNTTGGDAQSGNASNSNANVLGASTSQPSSSPNTGNVNFANAAAKSNKFMGLGYWWLVVLAALASIWFFIARRSNSDNQA